MTEVHGWIAFVIAIVIGLFPVSYCAKKMNDEDALVRKAAIEKGCMYISGSSSTILCGDKK